MILDIKPARPYEVARYELQFKKTDSNTSLQELMGDYMNILSKEIAMQQEILIMSPAAYTALQEVS